MQAVPVPVPVPQPVPQPVMMGGGLGGAGGGSPPHAVRTFVKMTGVSSLPETQSRELEACLRKLSDCLMQLSEMQNDASMPDYIRGQRVFQIMPEVKKGVSDLISIGGFGLGMLDGEYRDDGIAKHRHAFDLQQQLSRVYIEPASEDQCVKSQDDARVIGSLTLAIIESVMEVFSIFDRMTLDRIKIVISNLKKCVLDICDKFIVGKDMQQAAEYLRTNTEAVASLVECINLYSMLMTDTLKIFLSRKPFLPSEMFRSELDGIINSLRDLTPKLVLIAQGKLSEPGVVDKILGAADEGFELIKAIPRFSARVEMEFIGGGSLELSASHLRNSVCTFAVQDIGKTARAYALEVTNVVSQCRSAGINAVDCDEVQRALANVIKLAKIAVVSGDAGDVRKFELAVEELNKLVAALPTKFKLVFYEESTSSLDAAKELLNTGLMDFVSGMK